MWIERKISNKIERLAEQFPAVVITGARQTGKTSLLKRLFPNHTYVSLDVPSLADEAEHQPQQFLSRFQRPVIIDEVQYAPKLFRHLKISIDADRHTMGQYILTGSQKFVLMKEVSDSLAGRCGICELEPLSLSELSGSRPEEGFQQLTKAIIRGGFPDLWRDTHLDHNSFLDSYLGTYIERDVRQILNIISIRDFDRFVRACAYRNGQLLDKAGIARDVGVSAKAVNDWLSVLQASNQIVLMEPWFGNFGKRIVKSPKLYFTDSGLLCHLLGVTEQGLSTSPFLGAIWESVVFSELRRTCALFSSAPSIWFYRDNQQLEIDFLLLHNGHADLLECKWREIPTEKDFRPARSLMTYLDRKQLPEFTQTEAFVICRTPSPHPVKEAGLGLSIQDYCQDRLFKRFT